MQLPQHLEPVEPRQQQVEDDEIPARLRREFEPRAAVSGRDDRVPLGLEAAGEERLDSGLVLDDQDAHSDLPPESTPALNDVYMTRK